MKFLIIKNIFLLFFFCSFLKIYPQKVKVISSFTNQPLPNVDVFNPSKKTYTQSNLKGEVNLISFKEQDTLHFYLLGYKTLTILKKQAVLLKKIKMTENQQLIDEIVLSTSRSKVNINAIAEKVSIIDAKEINNFPAKTGADILQLASVRLQKSQGGGGSPVLRGFEANRVLLVIDGVRMNNAIYRSGHLQNAITIDPNNIERAEIIFGASSVAYGSDALGGVIHYYTKTPEFSNKNLKKYRIFSQYNSASNSFLQHSETMLSRKNIASFTGISYSFFGDIAMGKNRTHNYENWGKVFLYSKNSPDNYYANPHTNDKPHIQKNTAYSQWDIMQKLRYKFKKENIITVNIQFSKSSDIPRFDKLNEKTREELRFAEWYYGPQKRILISPQLRLYPNKKIVDKIKLIAAYQDIEESRINRRFNSLTKNFQIEKVKVWSFNADFETYINSNVLNYGLEIIHNNVASTAYSKNLIIEGNNVIGLENSLPIPTRYPSNGSAYNTAAIYTNFRKQLIKKLFLNIGSRYSYVNTKASWNETALIDSNLDQLNANNQAVNFSIGTVYKPFKNLQFNFLVASGFRSPNIDDLGKIRENNGFLLVPNPNIKPEYVYNYDLGIIYFSKNKKNYIVLRGFQTDLRNYIRRANYSIEGDTTTKDINTIIYDGEEVLTQANINTEKEKIWGGDIEIKWKKNDFLSFNGKFTFTNAEKNQKYGPLPSILPFFGTLEIQYKNKKLWTNLSYIFNSSKKPNDFSRTGEDGLEETPIINPNASEDIKKYAGTPKWAIFNLATVYNYNKNVIFRLGIENIFDIHYKTFASGISQPGRNFYLGIELKSK